VLAGYVGIACGPFAGALACAAGAVFLFFVGGELFGLAVARPTFDQVATSTSMGGSTSRRSASAKDHCGGAEHLVAGQSINDLHS
jgi:hypothetical protein